MAPIRKRKERAVVDDEDSTSSSSTTEPFTPVTTLKAPSEAPQYPTHVLKTATIRPTTRPTGLRSTDGGVGEDAIEDAEEVDAQRGREAVDGSALHKLYKMFNIFVASLLTLKPIPTLSTPFPASLAALSPPSTSTPSVTTSNNTIPSPTLASFANLSVLSPALAAGPQTPSVPTSTNLQMLTPLKRLNSVDKAEETQTKAEQPPQVVEVAQVALHVDGRVSIAVFWECPSTGAARLDRLLQPLPPSPTTLEDAPTSAMSDTAFKEAAEPSPTITITAPVPCPVSPPHSATDSIQPSPATISSILSSLSPSPAPGAHS
ncbi:hypothetical protein CVT26_010175 [Gymnopilus dilepis]|uniref:Uncharacterized protein n=1 Tax=Gymnopilus dilepis TaxID=231916 RepID=A0A409WCY9_9AGAR|nr:hypothetical protein CVT26_010175 [Gymnopilus dilepis]